MIQQISGILFLTTLLFIIIFSYFDKKKKRKKITNPLVSFVIPCYNDEGSLQETIESIYDVAGTRVDLIVINDKSTDASRFIIEKLQKKYAFTFVENEKNLGKSQSLNIHSDLAKHDIIFFVDADVIVNKKSFSDALNRLGPNNVGAVSCPYIPQNKGFIPLMQHIEYNMLSLVQWSYNLFSAIALWGGFIAIKKKAFLQVGKFSLNAITEDMDLAFKLNENGWKVEQSFSPIKTYVPDSIKKWLKQKMRWSGGGFQCFIKHYKIWLKNPIHIFFIFSYCIFISSAALALVKNLLAFNNIINYFSFINETLSLLVSLKLTGLLYGTLIIKDLLWMVAFTFFSLPLVLPLIKEYKHIYRIFLVIPFSIIYIPFFSIISVWGIISFLYNYKKIEKGSRSW